MTVLYEVKLARSVSEFGKGSASVRAIEAPRGSFAAHVDSAGNYWQVDVAAVREALPSRYRNAWDKAVREGIFYPANGTFSEGIYATLYGAKGQPLNSVWLRPYRFEANPETGMYERHFS